MLFIRNFQSSIVYVQLNIGYNGIITHTQNVQYLKSNFKLGDILNFVVDKLDIDKKRYILYYNDNKDNVLSNINKNTDNNANYIIKLNVSEKSFYPKSFLKMINEDKNNENINDNHKKIVGEISIYNNECNNKFDEKKEEQSIYDNSHQ